MCSVRFTTPIALVSSLLLALPGTASAAPTTLSRRLPVFLGRPAVHPAQLPRTGDDLVLESVAGAGLLLTGVALRVRRG